MITHFVHDNVVMNTRGFIKGQEPGKLTGCEDSFARLLLMKPQE